MKDSETCSIVKDVTTDRFKGMLKYGQRRKGVAKYRFN